MGKIVVHSDWGYFDRIEGETRNLAAGDRLALHWPNGCRQVVEISVDQQLLDARESIYRKKAFAETVAQGAIVMVMLQPIPGLEVERVPPGTPVTKLAELL